METTWVLVADRARARLFETRDPRYALTELQSWLNDEGRLPGRELASDEPGRVFDRLGMGGHRHAAELPTPLKDKNAERFARDLVGTLEHGRTEHRFQRLMLVAPPEFLGVLRGLMGDPLHACVAASVDKDLTRFDAQAIREHLPKQPPTPPPALR